MADPREDAARATPTSGRDALLEALAPVLEAVRLLDLRADDAAERLEAALPSSGDVVRRVGALVREGVLQGWLCDRESAGVRFSRVQKGAPGGWSVDAVHMRGPGPGHVHPQGEVDLCFAVEGAPRFDGRAPGWTVYPPGSWHVPTVEGGAMDILYFLPGGEIRFGDKPA